MASAAHAVEANLFSLFQYLKGWPAIELHDEPSCCWTLSRLRFPLFNSVMRARVEEAEADALIDRRVAACRERGVPMLWWTGPSTTPSTLPARLEQRGFVNDPAFGMTADLTALATADPVLSITPVTDRRTLAIWTRVLCSSFGAPTAFGDAFAELAAAVGLDRSSPFRHYLGWKDREAVATCSVFLGAGVAGIYDVGVVPECRRRGYGAAITRAGIDAARTFGYRSAILHASPLGRGMYRSLGFEQVCDIGQYGWSPDR